MLFSVLSSPSEIRERRQSASQDHFPQWIPASLPQWVASKPCGPDMCSAGIQKVGTDITFTHCILLFYFFILMLIIIANLHRQLILTEMQECFQFHCGNFVVVFCIVLANIFTHLFFSYCRAFKTGAIQSEDSTTLRLTGNSSAFVQGLVNVGCVASFKALIESL